MPSSAEDAARAAARRANGISMVMWVWPGAHGWHARAVARARTSAPALGGGKEMHVAPRARCLKRQRYQLVQWHGIKQDSSNRGRHSRALGLSARLVPASPDHQPAGFVSHLTQLSGKTRE